MGSKNTIKLIIQSPWFIALILTSIFLLTTGYKYGWDDQHLEIPLLKSLINSNLYVGDYYVESLKENFTSYLYPILAKLITVEQIPTTYFILFLISRYFLFFWIYKIWELISKNKFKAFLCVIVFILMTRVDEFLYRTFSHQEFALAIIFAGIYCFFREKFLLSAIILGLSTNIHALYSLFPMCYIVVYLLWHIKKHGWQKLFKVSAAYLFFSLPFLIWVFKKYFSGEASPSPKFEEWISLYLYTCPQNFLLPYVPFSVIIEDFGRFIKATESLFYLISFFILNLSFNADFRKNQKAIAFCLTSFGLLFLCWLFTNVFPTKLFLDLNLIRNTQYLHFILMGFTTIFIFDVIEKKNALIGFCFAALFSIIKYNDFIATCSVFIMLLILVIDKFIKNPRKLSRNIILIIASILIIPLSAGIIYRFYTISYRYFTMVNLTIVFILLTSAFLIYQIIQDQNKREAVKKSFYLIPLIIFLGQYSYYNYNRQNIEQKDNGFWRLRRNWEDMQKFVKNNTPIDSTILVPYDIGMGGFRIHSERKIIVSERDCGIIGFDFEAAKEWERRIHDIEAFKTAITGSITTSIQKAIIKYDADYIVFLRYAAPIKKNALIERIYTNTDFVLFSINKNSFYRR